MTKRFNWNDGGRASAGFVGAAGDCATRAVAIATGQKYSTVYESLGKLAGASVRDGVYLKDISIFLKQLGWRQLYGDKHSFHDFSFPSGPVILSIAMGNKNHHLCAVVDGTLHDTWDASEDEGYQVLHYWVPTGKTRSSAGLIAKGPVSAKDARTQAEFDKILNRLRALDRTASNEGSTEGEKRNAIRMIQNMMLQHNLSREDLTEENSEDCNSGFMRQACVVNGRRAASWEKMLAFYITSEVFPMVQWYTGTKAHRTLFWFYGPNTDVQNAIALFRELVTTIASAAQLRYGGYYRGSGASYAEGYVDGLPRMVTSESPPGSDEPAQPTNSIHRELIQTRILSTHRAAKQWLRDECYVNLVSGSGSSRNQHDGAAASAGRKDGAQHEITKPNRPKRITQR